MRKCTIDDCERKHVARGYCNKHYQHFRTYGTPYLKGHKRMIEFEVDENGCFICTSHTLVNGYPRMTRNNKLILISRHVYTEMFGEIPRGLIIRHKCDNPACINPEHLEIGTHYDNAKDRTERNRGCRGEKVHRAVLTEEKVRHIKEMLNQGMQQKEIAKELNIKPYLVTQINTKRTWKHIV